MDDAGEPAMSTDEQGMIVFTGLGEEQTNKRMSSSWSDPTEDMPGIIHPFSA